jgi:hypothetical protein
MSILNKVVAVAAFVSLSSVYAAPAKQVAPQAQKQEAKKVEDKANTTTPVVAPVATTTPTSTSVAK